MCGMGRSMSVLQKDQCHYHSFLTHPFTLSLETHTNTHIRIVTHTYTNTYANIHIGRLKGAYFSFKFKVRTHKCKMSVHRSTSKIHAFTYTTHRHNTYAHTQTHNTYAHTHLSTCVAPGVKNGR